MFSKKTVTFIGILSIVSFITPTASHAKPATQILPSEVHKAYKAPIGAPMTPQNLKAISDLNLTFKYAGAECSFNSIAGCTVFKSTNPAIPVGMVVRAIATRTSGSMTSPAAFNSRCSWCSVAGDFIAITLFVAFAPASTPVAIAVATYSVGIGIILGNA